MLWMKTKRIALGLYTNLLTILAAFCNIIQYIRRLLMNLLAVPSVVLVIMAIGTCVLFLIGAFMMDGPLLGNLGEMGIMCAAVIVIYFLAKILLWVASVILSFVLEIFNCEKLLAKIAVWVDAALYQYLFTIEKASITKKDYRRIYGLPNALQKIGHALEIIVAHIGILIYPLSALGGVIIGRSWYMETWDKGWRPVDYVVAVVMTVIIVGLMVYVGSYVIDALKDTQPEESPLRDVYENHRDFFNRFGALK